MDALPRPRPLTRLALLILPILLILSLSAWAFAHWRLVSVNYKFGSSIPPGDPRGEPDWWTFRARRLTFTSFGGRMLFMLGEYRSLAPIRDDLSNWSDYNGWETHIVTRAGVKRDERRAVYWNSADDFSFFGLGTFASAKQGESVRAIGVPYWLTSACLAGAAIAFWLPHRRRRERAAAGRCISCGYDLRSLAPDAACPECGRKRSPSVCNKPA